MYELLRWLVLSRNFGCRNWASSYFLRYLTFITRQTKENITLMKKNFMALDTKIAEGFKNRHTIHKPTECSHFILYDNGKKYLQLETTGSEDRQIPGKVSQSIQFSPEAIRQLKELLSKEF